LVFRLLYPSIFVLRNTTFFGWHIMYDPRQHNYRPIIITRYARARAHFLFGK
jgi:hypothetical protein